MAPVQSVSLALSLTATAFLASTARAITIRTSAEGTWAAISLSDHDGPTDSGSLTSLVMPLNAQAIAFQNASGNAAVHVEGSVDAGTTINSLASTSVWMDTLTNTTDISLFYEAIISIPEIQLYISGSGMKDVPNTLPDARQAGYSITVEVNGGTPSQTRPFQSLALLENGVEGHVLRKEGTDLGGVLDANELRYRFEPFTTRLPLGILAPNESLTLLYGIQAGLGAAEILGDPYFGEALVGDPLGDAHTSIEIISSDAAEPSTAMLFAIALMLGAVAMRTHSRRGATAYS
jgi:hypothetical protein